MKKLLLIIASAVFVFTGCTFTTAEDYYNDTDSSGEIAVSVSINCQTAVDYKNSNRTNAKILGGCQVYVDKDATVFDVLKTACKNNKIQFEYQGSGTSVYIEGIDYLYEFDCGDLSGWEYSVNDSFPNVGCNSYTVQDGDTVRWLYTCDLGKDIGNDYEDSQ
jgi:hypothetical protein